MKKAALIIAEKVFRDEEYQVPKEVLEHEGIKVVTVSTTTELAEGKLGLQVKPDKHIDTIQASEFDAILFIGGGGAQQYFDDATAHALARSAFDQGRIVGAICIAPVILAKAGLLTGRTATVFPDGAEELTEAGANYTGRSVEVDGSIVTGSGPQAAEEFGEAVVKLLKAN